MKIDNNNKYKTQCNNGIKQNVNYKNEIIM